MNTQAINAITNAMINFVTSTPEALQDMLDNVPVAVSYSGINGICAYYPTKEAAKEAYDEALEKGETLEVKLEMNGLVVSGKPPLPEDMQHMEQEYYQAIVNTTLHFCPEVEYIPNFVHLHQRANEQWMAS